MEGNEFDRILNRFVKQKGVRSWLFGRQIPNLGECLSLQPVALTRIYADAPRPSDDLLSRGVCEAVCERLAEAPSDDYDVGDTYLFHHYENGCAMGFVLGKEKYHPIIPTFAKFGLIPPPRESVRRFVVDLTSCFVDFVESSVMDEEDYILVTARSTLALSQGYPLSNYGECRIFRPPDRVFRKFMEFGQWDLLTPYNFLRFTVREDSAESLLMGSSCTNCMFCAAIGRPHCECAPFIRDRNVPNQEEGVLQAAKTEDRLRYVNDWASWKQFLDGVRHTGFCYCQWKLVNPDGSEMVFLTNSSAYSIQMKGKETANRTVRYFVATDGPGAPNHLMEFIPRQRLCPGNEGDSYNLNFANTTSSGDSVLIEEVDSSEEVGVFGDMLAPTNAEVSIDGPPSSDDSFSDDFSIQARLQGTQRNSRHLSATKVIDKRARTKGLAHNRDDGSSKATKVWTCEHCGQQIRGKKGNYNRHIAVKHRNEMRFKCAFEGCGQTFGYKLNAERHYRNKHIAKFFTCRVCPREFKSEVKRNSHMETVHDPRKESFTCQACGAAFGRKSTLNRHVKNIHSL